MRGTEGTACVSVPSNLQGREERTSEPPVLPQVRPPAPLCTADDWEENRSAKTNDASIAMVTLAADLLIIAAP